ncbi:MAG: hypothetical protein ACOYO1_18195 [Bacteroidales bacterium]
MNNLNTEYNYIVRFIYPNGNIEEEKFGNNKEAIKYFNSIKTSDDIDCQQVSTPLFGKLKTTSDYSHALLVSIDKENNEKVEFETYFDENNKFTKGDY